jgi:hypothetical protein
LVRIPVLFWDGVSISFELTQYGSLQKQIECANQELALIEMTTIKRKHAITVVEDLISRGVTSEQILQLINSQQPGGGNGLVNFAENWDRYWLAATTNQPQSITQQSNGSSSPGASSNNGLSETDQIRLNLLRNATTNILHRMGIPR